MDLDKDMSVIQTVLDDIKDADMVLVGLGEEFDGSFGSDSKAYENGKNVLMQSENASFMPLWQRLFRQEQEGKIVSGLQALARALEGKNYFVLSVSTNRVIGGIPWREGRLVMPCGSDLVVQCSEGCQGHLQVADDALVDALSKRLADWRSTFSDSEQPDLPEGLGVCPYCKTAMQFNNIYNDAYDENGYLPAWQMYTKWLQGTVNRKLVVLELGVGMKFPGVIRFPFEKVAYFNQKAKFYRIHKNLYHLTEELASKGVGIADNAIDWLQNL